MPKLMWEGEVFDDPFILMHPNTPLNWIELDLAGRWDWPENAIRGELMFQEAIANLATVGLLDGPRLNPVAVTLVREPLNPVNSNACRAIVSGT